MVAVTDALIRALSQDDAVTADLRRRGLLSGDFSQEPASSADEQLSNILARGLALQTPTQSPVPVSSGGAFFPVGGGVEPETSVIARAVDQIFDTRGDTAEAEPPGPGVPEDAGGTGPDTTAVEAVAGSLAQVISNTLGLDEEGDFAGVGSKARGAGKSIGAVSDVLGVGSALVGAAAPPIGLLTTLAEAGFGFSELSDINKSLEKMNIAPIGTIEALFGAGLNRTKDLRDLAEAKIDAILDPKIRGTFAEDPTDQGSGNVVGDFPDPEQATTAFA